MGYEIQSVYDEKGLLATLFSVLYSNNHWSWIDGKIAGVQVSNPNEWAGVSPATLVDGDYFVLQLPDVSGSDYGVVRLQFREGDPDRVTLHAHTAGWDSGTQSPRDGDLDLGTDDGSLEGDPTCLLLLDGDPPVELRTIVNDRRMLLFTLTESESIRFAYLGFIQSFHRLLDDPNPLLVTAAEGTVGESPSIHPLAMAPIDSSAPTHLKSNARTGLLDTDGGDMLEEMQGNYRKIPPLATPVLFPVILGHNLSPNKEWRGTLDGVFFFGPAGSLVQDNQVSNESGIYVVINELVVGPVA
jgi:hypothetical protein